MAFDSEDGVDDENAMKEALVNLKNFEWLDDDLLFYFGQIEIKMSAAGVKKQFTKFQILATIIPRKVTEEVKPFLRKGEADYPQKNSYKLLKDQILRIFGPKPEEAVDRALSRVLTSTPSSLARQISNDICKHDLTCDCCPAVVSALWKRHLSHSVRAGIAHMDFTGANFESVILLADKIHSSNPRVLAVSAVAAGTSLDETLPAIPYAVPEVSAVQRGGRGRGGRGRGRGRGRGNSSSSQTPSTGNGGASNAPKHKGTKHPDLPAGNWSGCSMHFRWGRGAHFCSEPGTCPWKNVFIPKEK